MIPRSIAVRAFLPAAVVCLATMPSQAIITSTWVVETYAQFAAGDAADAFITSLGEVRPGWQTSRVALEGDGVWSALRRSNGTVLLGTDADGAVFQVTGDKTKKVAAIPGTIAVVAMAEAGGAVYAAAMPSNQIWKLDVGTGKVTSAARLDGRTKDDAVETVWALAAAKDGTLYAGTGPDGRLWSIKGNVAKPVFETTDKRVTAVAVASDGAVWFGTSERALVFRYDPQSRQTRAMADFAGNEITAIAEIAGGVVVAANELTETTSGSSKTTAQLEAAEEPNTPKGQIAKMPEVGSKPGADKEAAAPERKGARKGKGAVFRIERDGRLDQLHALTQTYVTSLVVAPTGEIYAGAGDKGRVYLIESDDAVATAFDVDERAVAQLFWDGRQLAFTTDDTAALYRVTAKSTAAKYVSEVYDAKSPARWGRLLWQGSGKIALETRTGNTAKPDVGWSDWQAPRRPTATGGGVIGGGVDSPVGRYLQFRVSLAQDASLRRVTAHFVPQNTATAIEEITIEPATTDKQPTLKEAGSRSRSPVVKLKWTVDNPDGDDTSYRLLVRRDGEADWRALAIGNAPLTTTSFEWNTEAFPDGWYRLRVLSSDELANSADRAMESQRTTPLFAVDNTRPEITGLVVKGGKAEARAADQLSVISEMAYAVDDQPWRVGTTVDGIFDDQLETLQLALPAGLRRGTHTLAVRVADSAGNIGAAATSFVVP